ncbi:MAG: phosphocarrier protein HPr [Candidatus Omnitrophota bacterium]|jgi:phosphocarrier protein HPr
MSEELRQAFKVMSPQGLHARPASIFVKIANKFVSDITAIKDSERANGKSMMGILTLAVEQGSDIELVIKGTDANAAMLELGKFLSQSDHSEYSKRKQSE